MRSKEEIKQQIVKLKAARPKVRSHSYFGDDNLAAVDAQIEVLEDYLDHKTISF